jgi:hypothetical protein
MRWATTTALNDALTEPPIALPRLALPPVRVRVVPELVGDRDVDRALDAYRKVAARARTIPTESRVMVTGHAGRVAQFGEAWSDWARLGRHRGGVEEPGPDEVIADATRIVEVHVELVKEIERVEPAWRKVLATVARADGLRAARGEVAVAARRAYLEAVAAVPVRFAALANAEALARWCTDPDVVTYAASANPIAFTATERDRHGTNLRRLVAALALLAGAEPAGVEPDVPVVLEEVTS